jgi:ABC-type xylose transport system substrate-binding protein
VIDMPTKQEQRRQQEQNKIKNKLNEAGIKVHPGKKVPKNGQYSGIIGNRGRVLQLNI